MNKKIVRLVAVAAAMGGSLFNARASVDVSYKIVNANVGASHNTDGNRSSYQDLDQFNLKFEGTTYNNVLAGGIMISQPNGSSDALPNNYVSVCTDFLGSLYLGQTYKYLGQTVPVTSTTTGIAPAWSSQYSFTLASELFNTYGDIGSGGVGTGSGPTITVEDMAALQLAVWMVLYDTSTTTKNNITTAKVNYTSGNFQVSSAVNGDSDAIALAEQWVGGLTLNYNNIDSLLKPDLSLGSQGNNNGHDPQELMYASVPICSVPEPATILAGVLLILPLGVSTIRNLRKSQIK
ncbi:MAG TPA: hypothetical protein VIK35_04680 [Verrucomicrobiae bacterium]